MNTMHSEKRGPGRPRKEVEDQMPRRRKRETANMTGRRLGVNESLLDFDKYAYRWINDDPARVQTMTSHDDWNVVMQDDGELKEDVTDLGAAVSVVVGTRPDGSPKRAYLARKLRQWWKDDQRQKQKDLDEQLNQLRRGLDREGASQADYVPASGISIQG